MLQVQYVDLGDGSDPFVLGTTDWPIHVQCIRNPAWLVSQLVGALSPGNEPVIGTVEGGLYDLLPSQCVLLLGGCQELFGTMFSGIE